MNILGQNLRKFRIQNSEYNANNTKGFTGIISEKEYALLVTVY